MMAKDVLSDEQIERVIEKHAGSYELSDDERDSMVRFAKSILAAAEQAIRADERERIAQLLDTDWPELPPDERRDHTPRRLRGELMSREAFGDPPESQEPPQVCPLCDGEWHAEDCEFGKEVLRRLKAERDAHRMQFALHRLWPALERAMAGLVFTADRAGEVQADMNTLREYSKTPAGPMEAAQ